MFSGELVLFTASGPMPRMNVKRIALALVQETKICTVSGKENNKLLLDPLKMDQIKGLVRKVRERETDADFKILWKDIKTSSMQKSL